VEIYLGASPADSHKAHLGSEELTYTSAYKTESGAPVLRVWTLGGGAFLRMDYFDGNQFWLQGDGSRIWARWPAGSCLEDAASYLPGPVLGLLLRLRGVTCLHASAVAFRGSAIAFAGSEGAGKSTTAAALARKGYPVVADDIVALLERDREFFVLPAYPHLSLWPESVKLLYGPGKELPPLAPNWDKLQLSLAENQLEFSGKPLPLGAILILGERSTDAAAPFVETLPQREKLLHLIANSYATNLLDTGMRAREFESWGRLLARVPIWRLRSHQDASQIDRLCQLIEETCDSLQASE
jgi:hypothetical protein